MLSKADRKLLLGDPVAFISYYSGLKLKDFHCRTLEIADKYPRSIFLYFAGGGKSTLLSWWYQVYKITQNRNVRLIVGLKNDGEKQTYARAIRNTLAGNHRLIADWGRFVPTGRDAVWSNDMIEVLGREIAEPQPTILFVSAQSIDQVLGRRCDIFTMDDIVTPTTVSTPEQRQKQDNLLSEGVETSPQYIWDRDPQTGRLLVPEGISWPQDVEYEKGIFCGTVFHPEDYYHRKIGKIADMKNGILYKKVKDPKYVAIKYDIWRDYEKRIPMWPERWTAAKIDMEEKSKGTVSFNRRYRNIATDEGSMVFRRAWLHGGMDGSIEYPGCIDRTRSFEELPKNPYIVLGLDPSTGRKGKGTSFSSYIIMAIDRRETPQKRYIVDVFRKQMGFDDIVSYLTDGDEAHGIEGFYSKYHYHEARVESNAAQTYLIDNERVRAAGLHGCRILPHETQNKNRNDPLTGVSSMQRMVKDGLLSIPYRTPADQSQAQDLIDQLLMFPEGSLDDYCLALWFAEIAVRGLGSKYKSFGPNRGEFIVNPRFVR
jgi:hypothetical protein